MKKIAISLLTTLAAISPLFSEEEATAAQLEPPIQKHQAYQPFIYDRYMSPYMGAQDLLTAHNALLFAEDKAFGSKPSDSTAAGVGRLLEMLLFWGPLDSLTFITQHEFFGHGYRLREIGKSKVDILKYSIKIDRGYVESIPRDDMATSSFVNVAIGGVNSTSLMADEMRMRFTERKEINGRSNTLYSLSALDLFGYINVSNEDKVFNPFAVMDSNWFRENRPADIEQYVFAMRKLYPMNPLSIDKLKSHSLIAALDPYLWISAWSSIKYIYDGNSAELPMIPIMGMGYLPAMKMGLAPYGPELYFQNYFRLKNGAPLSVYYKWGSLGVNRHRGVGIHAPSIFRFGNSAFGFKLDLFDQFKPKNDLPISAFKYSLPILRKDSYSYIPTKEDFANYKGVERVLGGALSFIGSHQLSSFPSLGLNLELGYKTKGFIPGMSTKEGLIARGGFNFIF